MGFDAVYSETQVHFDAATARRALRRLLQAIGQLAAFPHTGRRRVELNTDPTLLFWTVAPNLIAYRIQGEVLEVVAIERASRDWSKVLPESTPEH